MRTLSELAARITNEALGRKYVALGRIAKHWEDIVGKNLADKAAPSKIKYRKYKNQPKKPEAVLEIATSAAHSTKLHYQKDLILERINRIFGERWITDIKFVTLTTTSPKQMRRKRPKPLSENDRKNLRNMLDLVDDPEIKQKLDNLGTHVISEDNEK